jgi:hypothetical protein
MLTVRETFAVIVGVGGHIEHPGIGRRLMFRRRPIATMW